MRRLRRIGLTMRVERAATDDGSARDALAHEWGDVLAAALPEAGWVALPNAGAAIVHTITALELDAVILTGGNDVGACARRDQTEASLLRHCLGAGVPVLGVCRGLQMVQTFFGGSLSAASAAHDAGRVHAIEVIDRRAHHLMGTTRMHAPSYHRFGVDAAALAPPLEAWALSDDGMIEALAHRSAPIVAVQWHPERPLPEPDVALRLLRGFCDVR
jgi:putative glutamine amidotransferase